MGISCIASWSDTAIFWSVGCLTILLALRFDSYLERRRAQNYPILQPEPGYNLFPTPVPTPSPMPPPPPPPPPPPRPQTTIFPHTRPRMSTIPKLSPDYGDGMTGYHYVDRPNLLERRARLYERTGPLSKSQQAKRRRIRTMKQKQRPDRKAQNHGPCGSSNGDCEARYARSYLLDWLDGDRAYLYC